LGYHQNQLPTAFMIDFTFRKEHLCSFSVDVLRDSVKKSHKLFRLKAATLRNDRVSNLA